MAKISGTVFIDPEKPKIKNTSKEVDLEKSKLEDKITKKEKAEVRQELEKLEKVTRKEIFVANCVFPFDFFPDKIIIDLNTVTVIKRYLLSRYVFPLHIEDIKTVRDNWGPFFASLEIEASGFKKNPPKLKFLQHKDATRARMYINALMDLNRQGIDIEKLSKDEIIKKLEEISKLQAEREPGML